MGTGFVIPWIGVKYAMVRDHNTMGIGVNISWVGISIYHGYGVQNIRGRELGIPWS
jgi:hypothetical protein